MVEGKLVTVSYIPYILGGILDTKELLTILTIVFSSAPMTNATLCADCNNLAGTDGQTLLPRPRKPTERLSRLIKGVEKAQ